MGDKKKKGSKAKAGEEEDDSTLRLLKVYRKKCDVNDIAVPSKLFKDKVDLVCEEGENLKELHMWEELGPVGVRIQAEDEGTRMICNYMDKCKTVTALDLMDNEITPLGCEFLGKILSVSQQLPLIDLRLDHNVFGTEGLKNLALGLRLNPTLERLSLKYCGITEDGAIYLQQILAYINSKLQILKLQGNILKNKGIYDLFSGLGVNDTLERINVADNQFGEDPKVNVIEQICKVMRSNQTLGAYNFRYNGIYDEGLFIAYYNQFSKIAARKFLEVVKEQKHIFRMKLTEHLSKEVVEGFKNAMKKRKPKKKKKKGKKGGKKKKK